MNTDPPIGIPRVLHETVDEGSAGQRIDNFLQSRLKGVPKTRIHRGVRRGEVRVNKGRIRSSYKLCVGDVVRIPPFRTRVHISTGDAPRPLISLLRSRIIYEDDEIIVINKPAGVSVHGGTGNPYGVIEILRANKPKESYLELVHRLDRDTSGCLVLAKNRPTLTHLHALLRTGGMQKRYLVLVRGKWQGGKRRVSMPLKKYQIRSGERMVATGSDGRTAITHFTPVDRCTNGSLLEVEIDTGRTHQIRVHAESIGFPVAGDTKYGDKSYNRQCRERGLKRMFLHAAEICYWREEKHFSCRSSLDNDLNNVLHAIGLGKAARKLV